MEGIENLKRTLLYAEHLKLNAKMVPFAGWDMPVQYSNVIEEHMATRNDVGLFDISHMGEYLFTGPKALDNFAKIMIKIKEESEKEPELVKSAPHTTPVSRLDGVLAARKPVLKFENEVIIGQ